MKAVKIPNFANDGSYTVVICITLFVFTVIVEYCDNDTREYFCGGVLFRQPTSYIARRTEPKPGLLEYASFLPYTTSVRLDQEDKCLIKYAEQCEAIAASVWRKVLDKAFCRTLQLNKMLTVSKESYALKHVEDVQESLSDPKSKSCLNVLRRLSEITEDIEYSQAIAAVQIIENSNLESDMLLDNLKQSSILKPCFDILSQNIETKELKTVEICRSGTGRIYDNLKSNVPQMFTYCIATPDVKAFTDSLEDNDSLEVVEWTLGQQSQENLNNAHLVIANNVIRKHPNIRRAITSMKEILSEDGFILVHEVTTNFHIAAPLDGLYSESVPAFEDLNERNWSIYCDENKWANLFKEEDLEVIYRVSDNLLSSIFLLRRASTNVVENQSVIDVNDLNCVWVDALKLKVENVASKPKGENLWIRADNKISGIIGMVNCLRREPGGERIR